MAEENKENLRKILEQTIEEENNKLFDCNFDTEHDRDDASKNFIEFYKLKLEEDKIINERDMKSLELDVKREIAMSENVNKQRELDIREREIEQSKKASKVELIKSGATLAVWAGISIGVMLFESNGGAILSKAFPGIMPKTKI